MTPEEFLLGYADQNKNLRKKVDDWCRSVAKKNTEYKLEREILAVRKIIRGEGSDPDKVQALRRRKGPDNWNNPKKPYEPEVWVADKGYCYICRMDLLPDPKDLPTDECFRRYKSATIDHVLPKGKRGGIPSDLTSRLENLRLCCRWCNNSKGVRSPLRALLRGEISILDAAELDAHTISPYAGDRGSIR
jgi:5-methylcytosine-specific restriction endonuclease McrA